MEWMTAAMGDVAPARMLVAVRARAPVAAMPPKKGATTLPRPRPTSSALGSCFFPVIASAMTAESRDSIAPSIAMARAAENSSRRRPKDIAVSCQGRRGSGGIWGMPAISRPSTVV
jgi:hypothetical protein